MHGLLDEGFVPKPTSFREEVVVGDLPNVVLNVTEIVKVLGSFPEHLVGRRCAGICGCYLGGEVDNHGDVAWCFRFRAIVHPVFEIPVNVHCVNFDIVGFGVVLESIGQEVVRCAH